MRSLILTGAPRLRGPRWGSPGSPSQHFSRGWRSTTPSAIAAPNDVEMLEQFSRHRAELEQLVELISEDAELDRLAPDFTRPDPAPLPPERIADYRRRLAAAGIRHGSVTTAIRSFSSSRHAGLLSLAVRRTSPTPRHPPRTRSSCREISMRRPPIRFIAMGRCSGARWPASGGWSSTPARGLSGHGHVRRPPHFAPPSVTSRQRRQTFIDVSNAISSSKGPKNYRCYVHHLSHDYCDGS